MRKAFCPGSVGELVQGIYQGKEVLVSLTVNRFSEVEVFPGKPPSEEPFWKIRQALSIALRKWERRELENQIYFRRQSSLPVGKGFASSTADIAASVGALAQLLGRKVSGEEIAWVALQIEPTDGTMFSPFCVFDHLKGEMLVRLPFPKYLGVVVVELEGKVETLEVNRERLRRNWEKFSSEIREAFLLLEKGLEEQDLQLVGKAATISSSVMQEVEKEEIFSVLLAHRKELGILGINRAHTGRAFGALFDWRIWTPLVVEERVKQCLQGYPVVIWTAKAISGGVRMIRS